MDLYPYKFTPIYQERIWGGRNLARLFGRPLPQGMRVGESWELADLPGGVSVVANGPRAGGTLTELTRELGPALLGNARPAPDGRFPLLLKYLDAQDKLSLQVHPDAESASRLGGDARPKTECWYVVESRRGFLYKGIRPRVTPGRFLHAVETDRAEEVVRRFEAAAGDFHYLPAGMVHALGAGVVVAEIQTPSDTTYRVTDWGRGRDTHLEQAKQCIRVGKGLDKAPGRRGARLVQHESFGVMRMGRGELLCKDPGRCVAIMHVQGRGPLRVAWGWERRQVAHDEIAVGQTVLLPSALRAVVVPSDDSTYLAIWPGAVPSPVFGERQAAGERPLPHPPLPNRPRGTRTARKGMAPRATGVRRARTKRK